MKPLTPEQHAAIAAEIDRWLPTTPVFHGVSYLDIARLKTRIAGLGAEPEPKEPQS